MKWKPDELVCVIRVKGFLLTVLWSALCSLHETPFLGSTYIRGLTLQVLSDIKCLALLPNVQESKCSLLGDSAHPPRLAAFPVLQVLNLLLSCVPSHSGGKEGEPHAPLGYCPRTPSSLLPSPSSLLPSEPCSVLGCCVLGCDAHWRGPFLPIPFSLKLPGHRIELPTALGTLSGSIPKEVLSFFVFLFYIEVKFI